MTTTHVIGCTVFLAACLAMFVPGLIQRARRNRARRIEEVRRHEHWDSVREAELGRVTGQRDMLNDLWHRALRRNQALTEHIGDEREAAAVQALADSPAYFSAMAAREAASIDADWFDLSSDER